MPEDLDYFYNLGLRTVKALEVPDGILASSGEEIYGCIFGRDSLITSLKLLRAFRLEPDPYYLELTKKILESLVRLQGKEVNIESGEEPGKCIHEFRKTGHEHLTKSDQPWYQYPDGTMRNFDTVDATPLLLIALFRYLRSSEDQNFFIEHQDSIELALDWLFDYGDKNGDGFIDYQKNPERKGGGLIVHSWMDSTESVFHEDEGETVFPIAPVEVQAYAYLALVLWSDFYKPLDISRSSRYFYRAKELKELFNEKFVIDDNKPNAAFIHALDGKGKPLSSVRSSIGHVLWASTTQLENHEAECILDKRYLESLVQRLMQPDIFVPEAGIRTLSAASRLFDPASYHNGSIWPHDNSIIAEGMENLGYPGEAARIRQALFQAYKHFKTPIELFVYWNEKFHQYKSVGGQIACNQQAWSAASMVADTLELKKAGLGIDI